MNIDHPIYERHSLLKTYIATILVMSITVTIAISILNDVYAQAGILAIIIHALLNSAITATLLAIESVIIYMTIRHTRKLLPLSLPDWFVILAEILLSTALTLILLWGVFHLSINAPGTHPTTSTANIGLRIFLTYNLSGMLTLYFIQSAMNAYASSADHERKLQEWELAYHNVKLQALQNQINPHFLFNSFNVLSTLVGVDKPKSLSFIDHLKQTFQYILGMQDKQLVSLSTELSFLRKYFFLLQIRFDKKVKLSIAATVNWEEWQIPPLTLQILVENAVKHNRMSAACPLVIEIKTNGNRLLVINNLDKRETETASAGIGLNNIINRYQLFTKEEVSIYQDARMFEVSIPLLKTGI
ncbi:histidine kinase [Flavihumibacter rivuli]|uniref:sensor histidine kinase n=1 Tax=Flavihumibacter rivuli TaxID=2838156 RepID=UPI001BDF5856|nr:histidine kinase [Flavihumibacter rivuli]ULQ55198.1 histidine kinase [Flavihumibacter rivuli]